MKRNSFLQYLAIIPLTILGCRAAEAFGPYPNPTKELINKKHIWKPEDIRGGLYVVSNKITTNAENFSDYVFQIGYNFMFTTMTRYKPESAIETGTYTLNSLADGWVTGDIKAYSMVAYTKERLAEFLNTGWDVGFRLATKEEVHKIINTLDKNFKL